MSVSVGVGGMISLERFWAWLKDHPNCIVRVGAAGCVLYDHDNFHWTLAEDDNHNPVVQLAFGKTLVGEVVLDLREALYVQASPDPDDTTGAHVMFEVMTGASEPLAAYHFLLTHGFDGDDDTHAMEAQ